jgi:hypothetical protein
MNDYFLLIRGIRMGILRRLRGEVNKKAKRGERREMGNLRTGGWLLLGLSVLAAGCSRQDTERLARVGKRIAGRFEALTADCRAGLGSSWHGSGAGLSGRVAARLRWDRGLAGLSIQVHSTGEAAVELKGTVRDLTQRRRAVELAESTAGVEKVSDQLQVSER